MFIKQTQLLTFFIALSFALASCKPAPWKEMHPEATPRTATDRIQYTNITPAAPGIIAEAPEDESAPDLARKLRDNPLGKYGYYNERVNVTPLAAPEGALPAVQAPQEATEATAAPTEGPEEPKSLAPGDALAKIALLLPLTGTHAPVAKSLQNAAEMAMFDLEKKRETVALIPFDTKGTEEGAVRAVENAISENVDIIIGPMFRSTTEAISHLAKTRHVPVISLSNDVTLAEKDVYVFGFNPRKQVKRVVDYAYTQKIRRFSALLPNNEYGVLVQDEMNDTLKRRNLRTNQVEYYNDLGNELSRSIARITQTGSNLPQDEQKSEALLIPEGGRTLLTIMARLNRRSVASTHLQLLGAGTWDDEAILREPRLSGSWFATSSPTKQKDFKTRFRGMFGYEPIRITSLAYDAVILAAALGKVEGGKGFTRETLTNADGFNGVNGIFRFDRDGIAERGLAVVEIDKGRLKVIDPSPAIFPSTLSGIR